MRKKSTKDSVAIGTWPTPEKPIRVVLPAKIAYDLRAFQKVQASLLTKFGCPECHSGLDIRYDIVRSYSVDDKLNIKDMVSGVIVTDG